MGDMGDMGDGCAPVSAYIAQEKARAAAMGKRETRVYVFLICNHFSMRNIRY